ncbi:hypothetical protein LX36DRAFT_446631 [Colletotrichum falcatum]|nr:hypothetical protein LX36DRAFT_446631 [Colletotrichum falcatum]
MASFPRLQGCTLDCSDVAGASCGSLDLDIIWFSRQHNPPPRCVAVHSRPLENRGLAAERNSVTCCPPRVHHLVCDTSQGGGTSEVQDPFASCGEQVAQGRNPDGAQLAREYIGPSFGSRQALWLCSLSWLGRFSSLKHRIIKRLAENGGRRRHGQAAPRTSTLDCTAPIDLDNKPGTDLTAPIQAAKSADACLAICQPRIQAVDGSVCHARRHQLVPPIESRRSLLESRKTMQMRNAWWMMNTAERMVNRTGRGDPVCDGLASVSFVTSCGTEHWPILHASRKAYCPQT